MAAVAHRSKRQICNSLVIAILAVGFGSEVGLAHQCQHSTAPAVEESYSHHNHHKCDHSHDHHHHHHEDEYYGVKKLPEELAEEEDLKLLQFGSHHDHHHHHHHHDGGPELSGVGLWVHAMGCSLLVSLASLICLILLPLIFFQGKPSKTFVDALAVFGAGAMLGDAFLHQLPHAFGGEHSHSHNHHADDAHQNVASEHGHSHSHAHSLQDLSIGLSILFGIILFLLVEKLVRFVEDRSRGVDAWGHGHHHHRHKRIETLKDLNGGEELLSLNDEDEISKMTSEEKGSKKASGESSKAEKQSESSLRKRTTSSSSGGSKLGSGTENGTDNNMKLSSEKESARSSSRLVFGYLNLFSDGVHNFTDGMALGSAFLLHGSVGGWSRTFFLLAHELPQEIGDFGILVGSGFSVSKALFFNFLSALVSLAGTALALLWGQDPGQSSLIEGFTAGGFIYIAVAGVLAEMNKGSSSLKNTALQLISLLLGISVALFISLVE